MSEDFYPFVDSGDPAPDNQHLTGTAGAGAAPMPGAGEAQGGGRASFATRISVYDDLLSTPRVIVVERDDVRTYLEEITNTVYRTMKEQGGRLSLMVIRELVENFIHARFVEPVISILDGGNTIRFADQGPGIADKERAFEFGVTSADRDQKRYIRGTGSGLPIVQEYLQNAGGAISIEDNLGQGTVVTVSIDPARVAEIGQTVSRGAAVRPGGARQHMTTGLQAAGGAVAGAWPQGTAGTNPYQQVAPAGTASAGTGAMGYAPGTPMGAGGAESTGYPGMQPGGGWSAGQAGAPGMASGAGDGAQVYAAAEGGANPSQFPDATNPYANPYGESALSGPHGQTAQAPHGMPGPAGAGAQAMPGAGGALAAQQGIWSGAVAPGQHMTGWPGGAPGVPGTAAGGVPGAVPGGVPAGYLSMPPGAMPPAGYQQWGHQFSTTQQLPVQNGYQYPPAGGPAPLGFSGQMGPEVSERGLLALQFLIEQGSCGPTALAGAFGESVPTWSRELATLASMGLIRKHGQKHILTDMGKAWLQQRSDTQTQ